MCEVEEQQAARVEVEAQEETKDYVRERLAHEDFSQEEADEIGFVPSALSEPAIHWCDNRCSQTALRYMQIAPMVTEERGEARTVNLCRPCCSKKDWFSKGRPRVKAAKWRDIVERESLPWQVMELEQRQGGMESSVVLYKPRIHLFACTHLSPTRWFVMTGSRTSISLQPLCSTTAL